MRWIRRMWWTLFGTLHVYGNDYENTIAYSVPDAIDVAKEMTGATYEPEDLDYWDQVDDAAKIKIWCDTNGDPCEPHEDGSKLIERTAREWCARGRSYLCTSEY